MEKPGHTVSALAVRETHRGRLPVPDDAARMYAPANRYNGLNDDAVFILSVLTHTDPADVLAAHKDDLADLAREQQHRDHPDLAVLDADLDRIQRRS